MASRLEHAFRAASRVMPHVPQAALAPLATAGGTAAALPDARRRLLVERNLRRADPTLSGLALRRAVQDTFESYAAYWLEAFRLPSLDPAEVDAGLSYEGFGYIEDSLHRGNGTIMVLPHLGSWEWAAFWMTQVHGVRITAVVERLEPPEMFDWFAEFRRALGINVVPLGPRAGQEVLAALRRNDLVTLLADRDIDRTGVEVDFFGETTTVPAGPATLALRSGADLLPIAVYQRDANLRHAVIQAPVPAEREGRLRADVTRISQDVVRRLEDQIRAAPTQWHLMSPNWPSDHEALAAAGLD